MAGKSVEFIEFIEFVGCVPMSCGIPDCVGIEFVEIAAGLRPQ